MCVCVCVCVLRWCWHVGCGADWRLFASAVDVKKSKKLVIDVTVSFNEAMECLLFFIGLPVCVSVCLFVCLFVCLSVCLSVNFIY